MRLSLNLGAGTGNGPLTGESLNLSLLSRSGSEDPMIEDDTASDAGGATIVNATKTAAATATVVTATRAKPTLMRINTIKKIGSQSDLESTPTSRSAGVNSDTPESSPQLENPFTPTLPPRIDIDLARTSAESRRPSDAFVPGDPSSPTIDSHNLQAVDLVDSDGRQSFGLFGSDEVDSSGAVRESGLMTNSRNTMMSETSVGGDGEIMIFWGGSDADPASMPGTPVLPSS